MVLAQNQNKRMLAPNPLLIDAAATKNSESLSFIARLLLPTVTE
jgi:hypothetical protein